MDGIDFMLGDPVAVATICGFAGAAIAALAIGRLSGRGEVAASTGADRPGAKFRVDSLRAHPLNAAAHRWLGEHDPDLNRLGEWFPDCAAELADGVHRLETEGEPFRTIADRADGRVFEISGAPEGSEAALWIAEAGDANRALAKAQQELVALRREKERLREIVDAAPMMAWRRDSRQRLQWGSQRYLAFAGSEIDGAPRELRGAAPHNEAGGRKRPGRQCFFDAATGERHWYEVSLAAAADGGELGFALDAAPIINAESTLRRFVETLTETFAHLKIGLAIFDRERRLGLFNPAFAEMMRLDPAWLASRPVFADVLGRLRESQMLPEQQDFAVWRRQLSELFEDAEAADYRDVWRLPGDVTIRVLGRPHPQGALAFLFEDISETMSLEERYQAEAQIAHTTFDRLEEGLAVFGPDGRVRFANPSFAAIWGFQPQSDGRRCKAKEVFARCAENCDEEEVWRRLKSFVGGGEGRSAWLARLRLTDGRFVRGRFAPLPDGSTLTTFLDITDTERVATALRDRNDALEAAEEIRGALIEQISHRLNTSIASIAENSRALSENRAGALNDAQQASADKIVKAAAEIIDAVHGVTDFANAQTGAIALTDGKVDLRTAFESVLDHIRRSVEAHDVRLAVDFGEDVGDISGDSARVRQILFNLITDAARRCEPGDTVEAGANRNDEMVEIWTRQPYPADAPAPVLRGLAHALVKRFAELHGGRVSVAVASGDGADGGARLIVTCALPATAVRADAGPPTAVPETAN